MTQLCNHHSNPVIHQMLRPGIKLQKHARSTLCNVLWLAMQSPILSMPESTCNSKSAALIQHTTYHSHYICTSIWRTDCLSKRKQSNKSKSQEPDSSTIKLYNINISTMFLLLCNNNIKLHLAEPKSRLHRMIYNTWDVDGWTAAWLPASWLFRDAASRLHSSTTSSSVMLRLSSLSNIVLHIHIHYTITHY